MDALTVRGFLNIAAFVGVPVGAGVAAVMLYGGHPAADAVAAGLLAAVVIGPLGAMFCYIDLHVRDLQTLGMRPGEFLPDEFVVMQTPYGIVHYRRGRRGGVFDSVGGKLVLTNRRLAFLAHRGQPWEYRLLLPLAEIERSECRPDPGLWPGELLVVLAGGEQQLFTFGAVRPSEPERWADAIGDWGLLARHPANRAPG